MSRNWWVIATIKGFDSTLPLKIWLPHTLAIGNLMHVHTQLYTHACMCTNHTHTRTRAHSPCARLTVPQAHTHTLTCAHTALAHRATVMLPGALVSIPPSVCDCLSFFLGFSTFDTFEKSRSGILWKYLFFFNVSIGFMDLGKNSKR